MATTSRSYRVNLQYVVDTKSAKASLDSLQKSLENIQKMSQQKLNLDVDFNNAAQAAKELQAALNGAVNVSTGKLNLYDFSKSLQQSNVNLSQMMQNLIGIGQAGQQARQQLINMISSADMSITKSSGMLTKFATTLKNSFNWTLASNAIHAVEGQISSAIRYVEDLNEALTSIRVVTGKSISDMADFAKQANQSAQSLSTTTKAFAEASLIYFQQGDKQAEAMRKAEITTKAANVAFSASTKEMSEMLTAVWNSYKVGGDQLQEYVDVMAALGAATASSTEEIATAMQKVAATANTVGVSMKQMSSIISTVASVTREAPSVIGTAYKTILARMGDLKLGETLEDGLNLGQVSSQLAGLGINILDANQNLRDMGSVIEEIGTKWQGMSQAQKSALAQVLAGKRQYTQLIALFENFDQYRNNMNIAENSKGTLNKQNQIWAEGYEAAAKRSKAAMEELYSTLVNDQAMIKFQNGLTEALKLVNNIVKGFGGLPGILLQVSSLMTKTFNAPLITKAVAAFDNLKINSNYMITGKMPYNFRNYDAKTNKMVEMNVENGRSRVAQIITGNGLNQKNIDQARTYQDAIDGFSFRLQSLAKREKHLSEEEAYELKILKQQQSLFEDRRNLLLGQKSSRGLSVIDAEQQALEQAQRYRESYKSTQDTLLASDTQDKIIQQVISNNNLQRNDAYFGDKFGELVFHASGRRTANEAEASAAIRGMITDLVTDATVTPYTKDEFDTIRSGLLSGSNAEIGNRYLQALGFEQKELDAMRNGTNGANAVFNRAGMGNNRFARAEIRGIVKQVANGEALTEDQANLLLSFAAGQQGFEDLGVKGYIPTTSKGISLGNGIWGEKGLQAISAYSSLGALKVDKATLNAILQMKSDKLGSNNIKLNQDQLKELERLSAQTEMINKVTTATYGLRSAMQGLSSGSQIYQTLTSDISTMSDKVMTLGSTLTSVGMTIRTTGSIMMGVIQVAAVAVGALIAHIQKIRDEAEKSIRTNAQKVTKDLIIDNEQVKKDQTNAINAQNQLIKTNNMWEDQSISANEYEKQLMNIAVQLNDYRAQIQGLKGDYDDLAVSIAASNDELLQQSIQEAEKNYQKTMTNLREIVISNLSDTSIGFETTNLWGQQQPYIKIKNFDLQNTGGDTFAVTSGDKPKIHNISQENQESINDILQDKNTDLSIFKGKQLLSYQGVNATPYSIDTDENLTAADLSTLTYMMLGIDGSGKLQNADIATASKNAQKMLEFLETSGISELLPEDLDFIQLLKAFAQTPATEQIKQIATGKAQEAATYEFRAGALNFDNVLSSVSNYLSEAGLTLDDADLREIAAKIVSDVSQSYDIAAQIAGNEWAAAQKNIVKLIRGQKSNSKLFNGNISEKINGLGLSESAIAAIPNLTLLNYLNGDNAKQFNSLVESQQTITTGRGLMKQWLNRRSNNLDYSDFYKQLYTSDLFDEGALQSTPEQFSQLERTIQASIIEKLLSDSINGKMPDNYQSAGADYNNLLEQWMGQINPWVMELLNGQLENTDIDTKGFNNVTEYEEAIKRKLQDEGLDKDTQTTLQQALDIIYEFQGIESLFPASFYKNNETVHRTLTEVLTDIENLKSLSLNPNDWSSKDLETNLNKLGGRFNLDMLLGATDIQRANIKLQEMKELLDEAESIYEQTQTKDNALQVQFIRQQYQLEQQSFNETIISDYNRQLEVMEEKWDKVSESISGATNKLQDFLSNLDKFNTLTEIEELRQQFKDAGIEANKAEELIERMTNKNNSKESRIIAAAEADSLLSLYNMRTVNERQAFTSWDSSIAEKAGYVAPTIEINSPDTSNIEEKQDTIAANTIQIANDVATIAGEKTVGQSKDIDSEKVASQKRTNEINQQIEELRRQGKLESENRGLYELRRTGGGKLTYSDIIAEKERLEEEIKAKKEEEERRAILEEKQIKSDSHTGRQKFNLEDVKSKMLSLFPKSNVDLFNRVKVPNSDGTYSTLESESIGYGDSEYLYTPITSKGKRLSEEQIISYFDTISKMAENLGSSIKDVDKLYGLSLIIDSVKSAELSPEQLNSWRKETPEQLHELQQDYYDNRFNPIQDLFYDYNNKWNVRGREEEWKNWADTYLKRSETWGAQNKANDLIQAAIATLQMPNNKNATIDDLISSGQVNYEKVEYDQIQSQLAAHGVSIPKFEEALTQAIENATKEVAERAKEAAERAEELRVDQEDKFQADETKKGVDAWREEQRAIQEQKEAERVTREDAYFAEESQRGLNQLYKEWEAKNLELMENGNFIPSSLQELMSKNLSEDQAKLADGLFEKYISLADSIKKNPEKFQAEKAQLDANVKQLVEIVEASMQSAADAADNHLAAVLAEAGTSAGKIETSMSAAAESAKTIEQSFTKKDKFEAWKNSGTQQVDLFDDILSSIESGDFDDAATAFNALRQSIPQENWDEIGGGIIEGINTGLQNKINDSSGEVLAAAVAFRQNTLEQFLSAFAINSPSPFFEPIGAGVAEGCVKGFLDADWHFPAGELKDQWYKDIAGIAEDLIKARNEELDAKFKQEYIDQGMDEDTFKDKQIQRRALAKEYNENKDVKESKVYKFREQKINKYDEEHAEDHGKISAQAFMDYFNKGNASAQFKDSMQKIAQKLWGDAWSDRFQNLANNLDDWDVFSKQLDLEIALNTEELQKQWQINLTHMVDRFQSALDQIESLNQEKAKQVRDYWLQTYEDIAKAQEAAFEGKSISESSSLEAQQRFVKQFLANGGSEYQVRELLTTTDINKILAATENSLSLSEMNANNREMVNDEGLAWNRDNTLAPGQTYAQYQEKWMDIFAKEIKDGGEAYKDSQLEQIRQIVDIVNSVKDEKGKTDVEAGIKKLDDEQKTIWDLLTNEEDPWKGLTQGSEGEYIIDGNQLASALLKISDRPAHTYSEWLGRKATAATNESNNKSILQREVLNSGNLYQTQNEAIVSMIKKTMNAWDWGSGTKNNLDRIFEQDVAGRQMFETYFGKDVELRYEDFQNALDYLAEVLRENAMAIAATKAAIENGEASDIAFTRDEQGVLRPNVSYDENGAIRGVQAYNIKSWKDLTDAEKNAFKVEESPENINNFAEALVKAGVSNQMTARGNAQDILRGKAVFVGEQKKIFEQMLSEGGGIYEQGFGIRAAGGGTDNNQYSMPTWLTVDENNKTGNANIDQYIQAENERRVGERMTNLQSDLGFNETGTLMFISNWSDTAKQWLESQGRANESLTQLDWAALDAATKLKMLAEAEDYRRAQMGSDALFGPEGQGGLIAQYDKLVRGGATNETRDLIATKSELVEAISAVYNASPEVAVKLVDNDRKLLVDLANGVKNKNDKQIGKASGQIVDKLYEYDAESVRAKGAKAAEGIRGQRHGIDNNNLTNMRRAKMFDSAFDNIDINHEHLDEMWKGAGKTGAQAYADAFSAGLKRDFKPSDGMKGLNEAVQNAANLGKDSSKIFSTMYNNLSDELKSTYKNGEDYARQMTTEAQATFDSVKATQGEAAAIQNLQQSTGLEYEVVELEPGEMPDQEGAIHLGPATETTTISGNAKINSSEMTVSGALQGQVNFGEVNMPITGQKTETRQGTNQEVTQEGGQQAQAKQRYLVPKGTKLHNKQIPAPSNNGGGKKGGGGGGGGKSAKHEKHATYKSSIPRYHRTNSHIENLSKTLNKVDSVKQRMYGKKLLDNMKTEIDYLKEQEKWYKTLLVEAKEWEKFDRELLTKNFSNVQFDEDGSIKNYVEVMKSIVDEYNKAVDKFNASEQEEADSNALSDAKEKMEEQKKLIENYEESIGKIHEAQNSILETQNKMADAQLEMIQTKLQNVTDWTQKERDLLEYINTKYEETLRKQSTVLTNYITSVQSLDNDLSHMTSTFAELNQAYANGDIFQAQYVQGLQDLQDQILETLNSIEDMRKSIKELYGDTLELWNDGISKNTDLIKQQTSALNTFIDMTKLQYGDASYPQLQGYYNDVLNINREMAAINKQNYQVLADQLPYYEQQMRLGEVSKENYELLLTQASEMRQAWLESITEAMQSAKDALANEVSSIVQELNKAFAGAYDDVDYLQEQFDRFIENRDLTLTATEQGYEIAKLNRQIDKDLSDTESEWLKNELRSLQDIINAENTQNRLTQYEIDKLQKQYEITKALADLEDARAAKDVVRLTRDENGNFMYQYTADTDKINDAEQAYEDRVFEMYQLVKEHADSVQQAALENMSYFTSQLEEIMNNSELTNEQKIARLTDLYQDFAEKAQFYAEDLAQTMNDLSRWNGNTTYPLWDINNRSTTEEVNGNVAQMLTNGASIMQAAVTALGTDENGNPNGTGALGALASYQKAIDEINEDAQLSDLARVELMARMSYEASYAKEQMTDLNTQFTDVSNEIRTVVTAWDNFNTKLEKTVELMQGIFNQAQQFIQAEIGDTSLGNYAPITGSGRFAMTSSIAGNTFGGLNLKTDTGFSFLDYLEEYTSGGSHEAQEDLLRSIWETFLIETSSGSKVGGTAKKMATGGLNDYTGLAWLDGTFTRPELVLNADDTQRMFDIIDSERAISEPMLSNIVSLIDTMANVSGISSGRFNSVGGNAQQQNVTINADFPNVSSRDEIKAAFGDIMNMASQYINSGAY